MSWEDKGSYWAWRGCGTPSVPPPSNKKLYHAKMTSKSKHLNGDLKGQPIVQHLLVTVVEGGKVTEVNREELAWFEKVGYAIEMPAIP